MNTSKSKLKAGKNLNIVPVDSIVKSATSKKISTGCSYLSLLAAAGPIMKRKKVRKSGTFKRNDIVS
jgi:hypothetical protein